ncbi:MAG: hypothetical protein EAX89_09115 [Candidatus Lokiarchaeota archaeon]|nr:hypothetical protein [Candidatus Lokiarchaeota archaeon]
MLLISIGMILSRRLSPFRIIQLTLYPITNFIENYLNIFISFGISFIIGIFTVKYIYNVQFKPALQAVIYILICQVLIWSTWFPASGMFLRF